MSAAGRSSLRTRAIFIVLAVVVAMAGVVGVLALGRNQPQLAPGTGVVEEVVDGDTLVVRLDDGDERVRLIGVDTPETVDPSRPPECFGAEASARTHELLPPGTEVRLERDVEPRDRFGRLLAYVFRRSDGVMVNRVLLQEGFAEPLAIAPNTAYRAEFADAGARARSEGRGLWAACARGPPPAGQPIHRRASRRARPPDEIPAAPGEVRPHRTIAGLR